MPQLEQIDTFVSQAFWLAVTFCLLYLVLWRSALPKIGQILRERQERIDEDLQKAEALKAEAEGVLAAYEEASAKARADAQAILRESSDRFTALAAEKHEALSRSLAEDVAAGEERINAAREQAMADVEVIASELAEAAVARLTGNAGDAAATKDAVAQVIGERG